MCSLFSYKKHSQLLQYFYNIQNRHMDFFRFFYFLFLIITYIASVLFFKFLLENHFAENRIIFFKNQVAKKFNLTVEVVLYFAYFKQLERLKLKINMKISVFVLIKDNAYKINRSKAKAIKLVCD